MASPSPTRLRERLTACPENVAPLRRSVVAYAATHGVTERRREDVALAVSEALSNAVLHAYVDRAPGEVGVEAWTAGGRLHVVVEDGGRGMCPRLDSPGLRLGLSLIGQITERLELARGNGAAGLRVRMTFAMA